MRIGLPSTRRNTMMRTPRVVALLALLQCLVADGFMVTRNQAHFAKPLKSTTTTLTSTRCRGTTKTALMMGLDMVTYLRTEWVSAALVINQTPMAADTCFQLGCEGM